MKAPLISCPDPSRTTPAMLLDNDSNRKSVHNMLGKLPKAKSARTMTVEAYISPEGKMVGLASIPRVRTRRVDGRAPSTTWWGGQTRRLNFVLERLSRLEFQAATVDSQPVPVYASVTVIAARDAEDATQTVMVMNRTRYVEDYGLYYSAPQRLRIGFSSPGRKGSEAVFDVTVSVDVEGRAGSVDYFAPSGARLQGQPEQFTLDAVRSMQSACFVPGVADGVRREMTYVERFTNGGGFILP